MLTIDSIRVVIISWEPAKKSGSESRRARKAFLNDQGMQSHVLRCLLELAQPRCSFLRLQASHNHL